MPEQHEEKPARLRPKERSRDYLKSHTRIATAIVEMIRGEAHGGVAIALTGKWGSGKSYCVEEVQRQLSSDERDPVETRTLHFDAWAHEGRPLGRAFLRALVECLHAEDSSHTWVSADSRDDVLRQLRYRQRLERPTPAPAGPRPVPPFTRAWFVTGLIPLGMCLAAAGTVLGWLAALGVGLALVGAVSLGFLIRAEYRQHVRFLLRGLRNARRMAEFQRVGLETFEPTSYEFQSIFSGLMEEAVTTTRRLVVIIDDLDRSNPTDAQEIWNTLRTFFQPEAWREMSWFDGYWLIVPFDRSKVTGDGESDAFIDRIFHVEFRVPEPLLTNWLSMLQEEIGRVFPECAVADIQCISAAFQAAQPRPGDTPTPRDIEQFVRGLYAQSLIRQPGVRLEHQALFVALRQLGKLDDDEMVDLLVSSPVDMARYEATFDATGLSDALASVHTGLPPNEAMDVLLRQQVELTFGERDAEGVKRLRNAHGVERLRDCVRHVLIGGSSDPGVRPRSVCNAAVTLARAEEESPQVWAVLRRQASSIRWWHGADDILAETFLLILANSPPHVLDDTVRAFLDGLVSSIREVESRSPPDTDGWARAVAMVLEYARDNCAPSVLSTPVIIPGDASRFVQYAKPLAAREDGFPLQHFAPACAPADVVALLCEQLDSDDPSASDQQLIDVLTRIGSLWDWSPRATQLKRQLQEHANADAPQDYARVSEALRASLRGLFALAIHGHEVTASAAVAAMQELVADQSISILLDWTRTVEDDEARCIAAILLFWDGDGRHSHTSNSDAVHNGIQRHADIPSNATPNAERIAKVAATVIGLGLVDRLLQAVRETTRTADYAWSVFRHVVEQTESQHVAAAQMNGVATALEGHNSKAGHYAVIATVLAAFEDGRLPREGCNTFDRMDEFVRADAV